MITEICIQNKKKKIKDTTKTVVMKSNENYHSKNNERNIAHLRISRSEY